MATVDLQGDVDLFTARIESLRRTIKADRLRLASGTLTAEEELAVELRLARTRDRLRDARRDRAAVLERASMADVALTIHTREGAAAASDDDEGGAMGAVRTGIDLLAAAGVVALLVLIVASPLIVLGVVAWFLLRFRRRRIDERLLADPRSAGLRAPRPRNVPDRRQTSVGDETWPHMSRHGFRAPHAQTSALRSSARGALAGARTRGTTKSRFATLEPDDEPRPYKRQGNLASGSSRSPSHP